MPNHTLTEREAFYCLCHVLGLGSVTIGNLKEKFGTYLSAWRAKDREIQKSGILTEKRTEVFLQSRRHEAEWKKEFSGLEQKRIRFITEWEPD